MKSSLDRSLVLDNIKFLLIILVVFGHLIEELINQNIMIKTVYMFIYSFHIPLFILISGMLAKTIYNKKQINKIINGLLIPFLAFTILYEIFNFVIYGKISNYTLNLQPYWILWFLFSLFLYKISLPIIIKLKYPILLSIVISLIAGYINSIGYFLSISRTIYFFPFFIIGYKLTPTLLSNKKLTKIPKVFFIIVLILNIIFFYYMKDAPYQWLYGSYSYDRLNMNEWFSWLIRLLIYFISFITSISVLMLVPNKELFISKFGLNSLYVYVWHGFFIKIISGLGLIILLKDMNTYEIVTILLIVAVIIASILSLDIIKKVTENIILKPLVNAYKRTIILRERYKDIF